MTFLRPSSQRAHHDTPVVRVPRARPVHRLPPVPEALEAEPSALPIQPTRPPSPLRPQPRPSRLEAGIADLFHRVTRAVRSAVEQLDIPAPRSPQPRLENSLERLRVDDLHAYALRLLRTTEGPTEAPLPHAWRDARSLMLAPPAGRLGAAQRQAAAEAYVLAAQLCSIPERDVIPALLARAALCERAIAYDATNLEAWRELAIARAGARFDTEATRYALWRVLRLTHRVRTAAGAESATPCFHALPFYRELGADFYVAYIEVYRAVPRRDAFDVYESVNRAAAYYAAFPPTERRRDRHIEALAQERGFRLPLSRRGPPERVHIQGNAQPGRPV